ncbi:hypothetical protein [Streptomyces sp. NPDC058398]|uniref:hypothetical protein n=1 Tax=Streptomyces sp. NPDC058398 TaxID=3346479 RepID=UPI0036694D0D
MAAAELLRADSRLLRTGDSTIRTYRDGWRILKLILVLARRQGPSQFHPEHELARPSGCIAAKMVTLHSPGILETLPHERLTEPTPSWPRASRP